jgi:hypothetical protein
MIQFSFTGEPLPSINQQEKDKESFIQKLGPFKEEFEEKNGTVLFNYSFPTDSKDRISFNLNGDLQDFIIRWNRYIKSQAPRQ